MTASQRRVAAIVGAASLLLLVTLALPAAAAPVKVAVFDIELYDTSLEGELRGVDPAETARLQQLSALLQETVAKREDIVWIDIAPLRERLATMPALYSCNGCETRFAAELGAERTVSGFVSKVSTLILYITLSVRDTASGRLLEQASVSIRGNTDESWQHGLQSLLKRQIFIVGQK